jgi:hypothetical protein
VIFLIAAVSASLAEAEIVSTGGSCMGVCYRAAG